MQAVLGPLCISLPLASYARLHCIDTCMLHTPAEQCPGLGGDAYVCRRSELPEWEN